MSTIDGRDRRRRIDDASPRKRKQTAYHCSAHVRTDTDDGSISASSAERVCSGMPSMVASRE